MGWVVKLLCVVLLTCLVVSLGIWVRRMQKRKALEHRLESWAYNCTLTNSADTVFVLVTTASLLPSIELLPTLESLFMNAFCPQKVSVGIVCSTGAQDKQLLLFPRGESDRESFPYASRFAHPVRMCGTPSNEGAAPARAQGLRALLMHERFLLLVHAHTRFLPGWERQLILEHGGVVKRVLTTRGEVPAKGEFPVVHDVDSAGAPFFRGRAFGLPPAAPLPATAASSRGLFGLSEDLRSEGVVGFNDLVFAMPHVDDLRLTIALRLRGFALLCPTRAVLEHGGGEETMTKPNSADRRHPWLPRLALVSLHALVACLFAEAAFARILNDPVLATSLKLRALHALPSLPWISAGMGRACTGPQTLRALAFVAQQGGGADDTDVLQHFRQLGAQTIVARGVLAADKARTRGLQMLMAALRAGRHHPLPRPGSREWSALVGIAIELNSESIQTALDSATTLITDIQRDLGVDLRDGSVTWEGFMGMPSGGPATEPDVREYFGSRSAFELERDRWVRGSL